MVTISQFHQIRTLCPTKLKLGMWPQLISPLVKGLGYIAMTYVTSEAVGGRSTLEL